MAKTQTSGTRSCPKCKNPLPTFSESCYACKWTPWYKKTESWFFIIAVAVGLGIMGMITFREQQQAVNAWPPKDPSGPKIYGLRPSQPSN